MYTVRGDILPIQVIDSRQLSAEENLWLKSLSDELDVTAGQRITAEIERQGKAARIKAYLSAIVQANAETIREVAKMSNSALTLEQVFEEVGWTAKWEAKGRVQGEERKSIRFAKNLLADGFSIEKTAKLAELDIEKVRALSG
jgi:predicted transposase YdaD